MSRFLNLPNLFTVARILLTPFVVEAILGRDYRKALVLIALAGLTDALDGPLARRFGCATPAGAILDPIADKILLVAVYLAIAGAGLAPWWLAAVVVGRDVLIVLVAGAAILFGARRDFSPSVWGKLSTIVQVVTAIMVLSGPAVSSPALAYAGKGLVPVAAAATLWSGLHYAWRRLPRN